MMQSLNCVELQPCRSPSREHTAFFYEVLRTPLVAGGHTNFSLLVE